MLGVWELRSPFFSSPKLNHCAQRNSLSIRSTCFLDGERYYCDNAYVGDIVTSFLCRYGLSNHLVTSLLEVFFTRCLEHQDNGKTMEKPLNDSKKNLRKIEKCSTKVQGRLRTSI